MYIISKHTQLKELFLTFALLFSLTLSSQVTIGSFLEPNPGSLLDLKEYEGTSHNLSTAARGMILPRVALTDRHNLHPIEVDKGTSNK